MVAICWENWNCHVALEVLLGKGQMQTLDLEEAGPTRRSNPSLFLFAQPKKWLWNPAPAGEIKRQFKK